MGFCSKTGCGALAAKAGSLLKQQKATSGCLPKLPEKGHTLGPWVCVTFTVGGQTISVGNLSSPETGNCAVIKSFEYGHTDGFKAHFVIQDQEGGGFQNVVNHLFKDWKEAKSGAKKYEVRWQFGWAKSSCGVPIPDAVSECCYGIVGELETSFAEGKYTVEFAATDLGVRMQEGGSEKEQGSEKQRMYLKDAIVQLLTSGEPPNVKEVEFKKWENGIAMDVGFLEKDCKNVDTGEIDKECLKKGPKDLYRPEGEDKVTAVRRWLRPFLSENKKGWAVQAIPSVSGGKFIIWEDRPPPCVTQSDEWWQTNCIGHFLINAGRESPVIEFNPKFRWTFDHLRNMGGIPPGAGGHVAPGIDEKGKKGSSKSLGSFECPPLSRPVQEGAGHAILQTPVETLRSIHGEESAVVMAKANEGAHRADARWFPSITEATLVIVGDPTLCRPDEMFNRTVTLTMYNPFFIRNNNATNGKTEWLSEPYKNCVITNTAWMVTGITHRIELGNYTTTLHLKIAEPGVDGAPCERFGLSASGWNPCLTSCK